MPIYSAGNIKTGRRTSSQALGMLFSHADAMGVDVTAISIAGSGAVSVTITQTLSADARAHLGLT